MRYSTVLITGAGGFIGQHLVRNQIEKGRNVRALDIKSESLIALRQSQKLEIISADICDRNVQRKAIDGVDVVCHFASAHLETGLPETEYKRINVDTVKALLEESRRANIKKFIHVSTSGVHGNVPNLPANEEANFSPDITYERTKLEGELVARHFYREYGFPVVILRPVWVYGPGCKRTSRLFHLISKKKFMMIGNGSNYRSAIYVTDFLDAVELSLKTKMIEGEVFIITNDELVTVRKIVDEISLLVGVNSPRLKIPIWFAKIGAFFLESYAHSMRKEPFVTRRSLKFFTNNAGFTCAKARKMLGFNPQISLRTGLEKTYHWWRADSQYKN